MRTDAMQALALAIVAVAAQSAPARAQTFQNYECQGGAHFELALMPDTKSSYVQLDGKSLRLPRVVSVTGTRYRKGDVTIWIKGERATLRRAGKRIECKIK
jgi:membrane-bound inhibitor of C-type lysozyme